MTFVYEHPVLVGFGLITALTFGWCVAFFLVSYMRARSDRYVPLLGLLCYVGTTALLALFAYGYHYMHGLGKVATIEMYQNNSVLLIFFLAGSLLTLYLMRKSQEPTRLPGDFGRVSFEPRVVLTPFHVRPPIVGPGAYCQPIREVARAA